MSNAVAFDLANGERVEELTQYSYQALAEGYFGVEEQSSYLLTLLNRFEELIKQKQLTTSQEIEMENLDKQLEQITDAGAPTIKAAYYQLKLQKQ